MVVLHKPEMHLQETGNKMCFNLGTQVNPGNFVVAAATENQADGRRLPFSIK